MMRSLGMRLGLTALFAIVALPPMALAEEPMIERFETGAETRWRFFTDKVMGGVSSGAVAILSEDGERFARMTGSVSTENNGGFIQMRLDLPDGAADGAEGVRLVVRGNSQRYFVHLRTRGTRMPWQYYQAGFEVGTDWAEVRLPFEAFGPSGGLLPREPRTDQLMSLGVVAYGRDHAALIDVREVGFY
jgi:hypothetical protein